MRVTARPIDADRATPLGAHLRSRAGGTSGEKCSDLAGPAIAREVRGRARQRRRGVVRRALGGDRLSILTVANWRLAQFIRRVWPPLLLAGPRSRLSCQTVTRLSVSTKANNDATQGRTERTEKKNEQQTRRRRRANREAPEGVPLRVEETSALVFNKPRRAWARFGAWCRDHIATHRDRVTQARTTQTKNGRLWRDIEHLVTSNRTRAAGRSVSDVFTNYRRFQTWCKGQAS